MPLRLCPLLFLSTQGSALIPHTASSLPSLQAASSLHWTTTSPTVYPSCGGGGRQARVAGLWAQGGGHRAGDGDAQPQPGSGCPLSISEVAARSWHSQSWFVGAGDVFVGCCSCTAAPLGATREAVAGARWGVSPQVHPASCQ